MILDHIGFHFSDFPKAKSFLLAALKPLGITAAMEGEGFAMLGRDGKGQFWLDSFGPPPSPPIHVAFSAQNREQVRQFHKAALAAGARDNGPPGIRENYHPNYYAAFVIGPDGHNFEAVCHLPEG